MNASPILILRAVGESHARFKALALELRNTTAVVKVTHWLDILALQDSVRIEESVDAEHFDGEATSWGYELDFLSDCALLKAEVRRYHRDGQDLVRLVAENRYDNHAQLCKELAITIDAMCSGWADDASRR